ncbi:MULTISPECIES: chorismate--pyruvate lyase family protein [unclassified Colwellia]|uniref:chorismate--pyruvate lyase family protein n=1 Tax=unclassified Colwellia TaxID=196834 RepID=UPI0015F6B3EC|nr:MULTISPECIES: chorismate lyase [unclassified Colwellia]MBA6234445.1 chorismate lyase [Colwellia sp. MB02u-7]MBA6236866.1 chorismate lyase [Colwellia sp. MB02u-11]MBA6256191.1 chorismate lyase [Colwellia sp. MB3u-28]MBA6260075.1 chorismate lyase [Colwellia sp. MB3u-41]MBA6299994.1 chorismate lyase [Colwellia sp. MB3u-22]
MSQSHPLFPITINTTWQSPLGVSLNDTLLSWLLDPSSLTARLSQCCQQFRVEVLGQEIQLCSEDESTADISVGEQVLVREVLLYCDDMPQVFARSLLPLKSLTGEEQQLAHLGNQSLGQVLFSKQDLYRKCIEISAFSPDSAVAKLAQQLGLPTQSLLWGRRSTFMLHRKPLMVAEIFLPNAFAYQSNKPQEIKES